MDIETAIQSRYSEAAHTSIVNLCYPRTDYNAQYLKVIPQEVIERDYGCGNPSPYVRAGETVLDLGSGTGKMCFITAQMVGAQGRVIGVDLNDDMLALARKAQPIVAEKLGYENVSFRKGRIEDLGIDCDALDTYLREHPITSDFELRQLNSTLARWRVETPLLPDDSIDIVLSNCVLNLVSQEKKTQMFSELARVLKPGGRVVISDIVSDEDVPAHLQADARLWSSCFSGAIREDRFLTAFAQAGLHGITLVKQDLTPRSVIEGIGFRSVTVMAYKSSDLADLPQEVVFRGPFVRVELEDGTVLERGRRTRVSTAVSQLLSQESYRESVFPIQSAGSEGATFADTNGACCGPDATCC